MRGSKAAVISTFCVFVLVYLLSFDSFRFISGDWCNIPRLGELFASGGAGAARIATNEWMSGALPLSRTNAVSFFYGGDWGIKCRLGASYGNPPRMARPGFSGELEDSVALRGYFRPEIWRAKKYEILSVVFRYRNGVSGFPDGPLKVFRDFEDYKAFKSSR